MMSAANRRIDTHVHTEATAPYLKGDDRLAPYHEHGARRGLEILCITDHYHYLFQDPRYLFLQRKHLDLQRYEKPRLYLGTEQTILGRRGQLGIRKKVLPILDVVNVSIHWFGIGMPGLRWGTRFDGRDMKRIAGYLRDGDERGRRIMKFMEDAYVNALRNEKLKGIPAILGHPWDQFLSRGLFFQEILESLDRVAKVLQETGSAFEFNDSTCKVLLSCWDGGLDLLAGGGATPGIMEARDFLVKMGGTLNDHGVLVSFASDAHRLEDIGRIDDAVGLFNAISGKTSMKATSVVDQDFFSRG